MPIFGIYYNSLLFQLEMTDKQEWVSDLPSVQTDPCNLTGV